MEVEITDKGRDYFARLNEELSTAHKIDDETRYPDYIVLFHLEREGGRDPEELIEKKSYFPKEPEMLRKSFRRLFEAGYIEEY